ncbi:hypothetical protein D3C84_905640 [compost metagenome]
MLQQESKALPQRPQRVLRLVTVRRQSGQAHQGDQRGQGAEPGQQVVPTDPDGNDDQPTHRRRQHRAEAYREHAQGSCRRQLVASDQGGNRGHQRGDAQGTEEAIP